jgi:hypothetical protein
MRNIWSVAIWTGGLMLVFGSQARGQDMPCSFPPCMPSIVQRPVNSQPVGSQRSGSPQVMPPQQTPNAPIQEPGITLSPQIEQEQAKLRNTDRQRKLIADTQKLLSLATELKTDVDKSTRDTMSLDVIKKADEIEKLAHSVKEKMKGS